MSAFVNLLASFYCMAMLALGFSSRAAAQSQDVCLYGANENAGKFCTGTTDPKNLAQDPDIRRVIATLGLDKEDIKFVGCEGGRFATRDASPVSSTHRYRISYPILDEDPGEQKKSGYRSPYLAPITHELSHVLQLRLYGGMEALKKAREMRRIELAADFMSGVVFDRTEKRSNLNSYQQHLSLVGLYKESDIDAHGTWEQRTYAFRRGAFLKPDPNPIPIMEADSVFQAEIYPEVVNVKAAETAPNSPIQSKVQWNMISDCAEAQRIHDKVVSAAPRPIAACRPPNIKIEKTIDSSFAKRSGQSLCFLSEPPSPLLKDYSCFQLNQADNGALTCMRPASKKIISDHFSDKHTSEVAAYMQNASACGTNVDASVALPSFLPQLLTEISKFEFGFVRSLGTATPATGQMQHGFASLDPSLPLEGVEALEYVSLFTGSATVSLGTAKRFGNWVVTIDEAAVLDKEMNRHLGKAGVPLWIDVTDFSFRRSTGSGPAKIPREQQIRSWRESIASDLTEEGFERVPDSKLKTSGGKDIRSAIKEIGASVPYGLRESGFFNRISEDYQVLLNEDHPNCTDDQQGAVGAYIFAIEPDPVQPNDYGSLALYIVGMGECGKYSSITRRYIKELGTNARDTILQSLENAK